MSNVSLVSICESVGSAIVGIGEGVGAVCAATADAVKWLTEETEEDRAAVEMLKEERRQGRLNDARGGLILPQRDGLLDGMSSRIPLRSSDSIIQSPEKLVAASGRTPVHSKAEPIRLTRANLHLKDTQSLVRSAEKLGYRVAEPLVSSKDDSSILLSRSTGERLALSRSDNGKTVIQTAGQYDRIGELVRQHTLDRATEHLRSKGMTLQMETLANGEVQILAKEQEANQKGGAVEVRTITRADGTVLVDVDKVKGNRCDAIVNDLVSAVGGEVSHMKKKDAYFQLPGEPAKAKVRI